MNSRQVDGLNVVLILGSLALALTIPFELFVFSYAVLGPLHYLTEINWLKNKSYFLDNPNWIRPIAVMAVLISIPVILSSPLFSSWVSHAWVYHGANTLSKYSKPLLVLAFFTAGGLILKKKQADTPTILAIGLVVLFLAMKVIPSYLLLLGAFLPTMIHVYIFTLFFMAFGYLKSKNNVGLLSILLLLASPIFIILIPLNPQSFSFSTDVQQLFATIGFDGFSNRLAQLFSTSNEPELMKTIQLKAQIFVSFAYTYHYLNWFSKTTVIGWNKNTSWLMNGAIGLLWLGFVSLYILNNTLGLAFLFTLSLFHVLLEFPLNARSIKDTFLALVPKK